MGTTNARSFYKLLKIFLFLAFLIISTCVCVCVCGLTYDGSYLVMDSDASGVDPTHGLISEIAKTIMAKVCRTIMYSSKYRIHNNSSLTIHLFANTVFLIRHLSISVPCRDRNNLRRCARVDLTV